MLQPHSSCLIWYWHTLSCLVWCKDWLSKESYYNFAAVINDDVTPQNEDAKWNNANHFTTAFNIIHIHLVRILENLVLLNCSDSYTSPWLLSFWLQNFLNSTIMLLQGYCWIFSQLYHFCSSNDMILNENLQYLLIDVKHFTH